MIVMLGWGSLIWDPRDLAPMLSGDWNSDGPMLPVEYCRQSRDGRLTLALLNDATPVRVLWSKTNTNNLAAAKSKLALREGCPSKYICILSNPDSNPFGIGDWMREIGASGAVWTGLPPKFCGQNGIAPTAAQAVDHLRTLKDSARLQAEKYIRMTPPQIRTAYRRVFEEQFGWFPSDSCHAPK